MRKRFCDGCGAEAPVSANVTSGTGLLPPIGRQGDGLNRQVALYLGNNLLDIECCVDCYARVKSALVDVLPKLKEHPNIGSV